MAGLNPFRTGDRVYIIDSDHRLPVLLTDGELVLMRLDDGSDLRQHYNKVSFSPWPKPDHKRPKGVTSWLHCNTAS